ncbi:MAG: TraR/DksA C4-type zinc finger protein [Bacteroidota bacterium]
MAQVETSRYSDKDLEAFKQVILSKIEATQKDLDYYKEQLKQTADNEDTKLRGLDDGIGTAEAERLQGLASRQQKYIGYLKNALIRIDNKSYGICRETGKLISKERLLVVPHATLSIEAKQNR